MSVRKKEGPLAGGPRSKKEDERADRKTSAQGSSGVIFSALREVLPPELRDLRAFLLWRSEQEPGEDKARKVPYCADGRRRHGENGSAQDRRRLATFAEVEGVYRTGGYDGIGLALLPELNITALDFDDCRAPDGTLSGPVLKFSHESYAEISPSGTGVRVLLYGSMSDSKREGVQIFSTKGWVTLTGRRLNSQTVAKLTADTRARLEALPKLNVIKVKFPTSRLVEGERNNALTSLAGSLRKRGMGAEAIEAALMVENERRCDPPLAAREVGKIAKSVGSYPAGGEAEKERALAFREQSRAIGEGPPETNLYPGLYSVPDMLAQAIFISDGSQVTLRSDPRLVWAFPDFVNLTRASEVHAGPGRPASAATVWLKHPQRVTVHTRTFRAGADLFCKSPNDFDAVNTWREPPRHKPPADWRQRAQAFLDHVGYLVPIEEEREFFLNWLAHIEQAPGVLPHVHVLMFARRQGIGRNWLASVLARAWPGVTALDVDLLALLDGGFNGRLARKVFAVVNEIRTGGSHGYRHADRLKSLLTDETRRINPKFGREYDEFNATRWLMFSNHENALPLDRFDRRIYAIQNPERPRASSYYAKIYQMASDPALIASVREALRGRDISKFNPGMHAPLSETKQKVIEAGMPEPDRLMIELVDSYPGDCITATRLGRILWSHGGSSREMAALGYIARRAEAERYPKQVAITSNGKRHNVRVWILRNYGKWLAADPREVAWEITRGESVYARGGG